jgi:hypothetical protein
MVAPLTQAAIAFVEERRKGAGLSLRFVLRYQCQLASENPTQPSVCPVFWNETNTVHNIAHSDWLKRLNEMQWGEFELFEMAMIPLVEDPNLLESVRLLRKARQELRAGDYAGVLVNCREAFESAAKFAAQGGGVKKGFEALLTQTFPEHNDKPNALNDFVLGLSPYFNLARHAQYPPIRFTRAEAEFILATTVSFFSLIGRRLAKLETVD